MARTKRCRVSRFRGITNRHPGILHHGRSIIDLTSSSQIQKILNSDLNDNLSNQFILREQETPDKPNAADAKQRKGAHSKNNKINFGENNSEKEELKTKKRRTKRKKEQPQNQEQIEAETEKLNAYFGEVNDFDLQYETMPREKRQYVDKAFGAYTTLEEVNSATSFWLDEVGSNAKTSKIFATSTSSSVLHHQPSPKPPPVTNSVIRHPMDEFKPQRQQTIMAYSPIITQPTVLSPPHRVLGASLASGVRQRSHPATGHHSQVTHSRGKPPPTPPTDIQPHKEESPSTSSYHIPPVPTVNSVLSPPPPPPLSSPPPPPPLQSKPSLPDGSLPSSSVDIKTLSSDANSRSNLLQQIQQGTKLKKVSPLSSDRTPVPTNPPSLRDNVIDQIRQGITFNHVDQEAEAENIWHSAGDGIHVQEIGGLGGALKERHTNTNSEGLKNFLELCEQSVVLTWEEFQSPSCSFEKCSKIGEGAFGEVFKALVQNVYVALKIIPFAVNAKQCGKIVNGDSLKPAKQIFNEVYITKELTKLSDETGFANFATPSFVQLIMSKIVKGPYPHILLKAWDAFKKAKPNMTENERPDTYADDTQHFLIIALSYGGQDMESYKIRRGNECYSIFYQLALSIAVAEEAIEFEHRDLHLGNVLIDNCPVNETICYTFHGQRIQLISNGVKVSIIDFSLSRMHKKSVDLEVYMDLSKDTALFRQEGVKDGGDFQYDVYRLMREATENVWKNFVPKTNVFWLSYAAKKLFSSHFIRAKRKKELNKLFSNFEENEKISDFLFSDHFLSVFKEFTLE